jgi:3-methyladenine DNA glycosylase/8-oxoguanine DNA glycosylase
MADGHVGYVMPIGGVAAYRNQVSVVGVGFDIACGNAAIRTDLTLDSFGRTPEEIHASLSGLGVMPARAASIVSLARAVDDGLSLEPGADPDQAMARLTELPGIGSWTAHYIAMRALRWTDAFPKEDIVIRRQLGGISATDAERLSMEWRPWRSYATLHLWRSAG